MYNPWGHKESDMTKQLTLYPCELFTITYSTNKRTIFLHIWVASKQVPKVMMYFLTLLKVQGYQCLQILSVKIL